MKRLFFAMAILPCVFIACTSASHKEDSVAEMTMNEVASAKQEDAMLTAPGDAISGSVANNETNSAAPDEVPASVVVDWDKKIIKTANVTLEVKNNGEYADYIRTLIKKHGGYIFKEDNSVADDKQETSIVIKVPVLQFENLVNGLVTKDVKQLQRGITSEDVTGSIIDIKARLATRKATRDKYLEFLQKAGKVEDVLKVQQEINNIQEDIESAEARLAQLSGEAKYSTINLVYFEPGSGYSYYGGKAGFGARVITALKNGGKIFADIFIGIVTLWPLWVGAGLVLFIIKKFKRKRTSVLKKNL
mgnify:CR=1 FL=1